MNANADNPLLKLRKLGQSVWQDDIGRNMLDDGTLAHLIEADGIAGVTSSAPSRMRFRGKPRTSLCTRT
jgi:hypothetical protein